jgi:hypothetical protein
MPASQPLTTHGMWMVSKNQFVDATAQFDSGNVNLGMEEIALGLWRLNEALLATLTQMSADIAELKAEVASLKAKPTFGPQAGLNFTR